MSKNFRIDYQREARIGFQVVVYGASKSTVQLEAIVKDFRANKKSALITRVQQEKADFLCQEFKPNFYDKVSGALLIGEFPGETIDGEVAILSGGTSDQFLVNEIYYS